MSKISQNLMTNKRYFVTCARLMSNKNISLVFFTKESCQLCVNAKDVLDRALKDDSAKDFTKNVNVKTVDIMKPENSEWFDVYCYDVPVLHIEQPDGGKPVKFMHYFDQSKILGALSDLDQTQSSQS